MKNSAVDIVDKFGMILIGVLIVSIGMLGFTYYDLKKTEEQIAIFKSKRDKELDRVLERMIKDMENKNNE